MDLNKKENNQADDEKGDINNLDISNKIVNKDELESTILKNDIGANTENNTILEEQDFKIPQTPKKVEDKQYLKSMISTVFESDKDDNEKANQLMNQLLKSSTNFNENDTLFNENDDHDDTNKKRKFFNKINVNQNNQNNNNNINNGDDNDDDHDHNNNREKKKPNTLKYDEDDEFDSILIEKKKESETINKNKKKEKFKF
ncbi:hypothetical protein ACTFIT_008249 [Dictyostelium discoideum]